MDERDCARGTIRGASNPTQGGGLSDAASRNGDFDALVAVLDPDVVLRAVSSRDGPPFSLGGFTVRAGRSSPSTSSPTPSAFANSILIVLGD